jgi:hypothetical protein
MRRPARPSPPPGGVKPRAEGGVDAGGFPGPAWPRGTLRSPWPSARPCRPEPLAPDLGSLLWPRATPCAALRRALAWCAAAAPWVRAVPGAALVTPCPSVRAGAPVAVCGEGPAAPFVVCRIRATAPSVEVAMTAPTASAFAASTIEAVFPDTAAATLPALPAWAELPPMSRASIPVAAAAGSAGAIARNSAPRAGIALAKAAQLSHSWTCARTRRPRGRSASDIARCTCAHVLVQPIPLLRASPGEG